MGTPLADTQPVRLDTQVTRPNSKGADVASGELVDNRYRILERLGQGGMGAVFRAHDVDGQRDVAIKILTSDNACDPEFVARFQREARTTGALDHPAVVPVYAVGKQGARHYLVMQLLDGETLELRLSRGKLTMSQTLEILRPLVSGLAYLHGQKLVHRDVKPGNVMLRRDGGVTLMDFGLVRGPKDPSITRDGFAVGTPGAMSPEQILGEGVIDGRADQYALGVLLFECLTGHMPFEGLSDVELLRKHIEEPIPDPRIIEPEMPTAVADVILRAMAKKPQERFLNVEALLAALENAASGNGVRPTTSGSRWLARVLGLTLGS